MSNKKQCAFCIEPATHSLTRRITTRWVGTNKKTTENTRLQQEWSCKEHRNALAQWWLQGE